MASEEEQKENQAPAKSSKMKILIPVLALLILAGGGAGAYFKFFANSTKTEEGQKEKEKETAEPILKEMDTFIVNLSDPGGKRFLKITMKARLDSQQASNEFTSRIFEFRDAILMILSAKESEEVSKPSDKLTMKQEIITAINRSMKKGQVQDIYFTEFLIQ